MLNYTKSDPQIDINLVFLDLGKLFIDRVPLKPFNTSSKYDFDFINFPLKKVGNLKRVISKATEREQSIYHRNVSFFG